MVKALLIDTPLVYDHVIIWTLPRIFVLFHHLLFVYAIWQGSKFLLVWHVCIGAEHMCLGSTNWFKTLSLPLHPDEDQSVAPCHSCFGSEYICLGSTYCFKSLSTFTLWRRSKCLPPHFCLRSEYLCLGSRYWSKNLCLPLYPEEDQSVASRHFCLGSEYLWSKCHCTTAWKKLIEIWKKRGRKKRA